MSHPADLMLCGVLKHFFLIMTKYSRFGPNSNFRKKLWIVLKWLSWLRVCDGRRDPSITLEANDNEFCSEWIHLQLSFNNGDFLSSEAGKIFAVIFYSFDLHYGPSMGNNSSGIPKGLYWKRIFDSHTRRLGREKNKALRIFMLITFVRTSWRANSVTIFDVICRNNFYDWTMWHSWELYDIP